MMRSNAINADFGRISSNYSVIWMEGIKWFCWKTSEGYIKSGWKWWNHNLNQFDTICPLVCGWFGVGGHHLQNFGVCQLHFTLKTRNSVRSRPRPGPSKNGLHGQTLYRPTWCDPQGARHRRIGGIPGPLQDLDDLMVSQIFHAAVV